MKINERNKLGEMGNSVGVEKQFGGRQPPEKEEEAERGVHIATLCAYLRLSAAGNDVLPIGAATPPPPAEWTEKNQALIPTGG